MYEEYANQRQELQDGERGRCLHCSFVGVTTGSLYEWPCPILKGWICETHCFEIQLESGADTREAVASQIAWKDHPNALRAICRECPHGDLATGT